MTFETYDDNVSPTTDQGSAQLDFQSRFEETIRGLAGKEYPASDEDLDQLKQQLLRLPLSDSAELAATRRAALNNPTLLRQLFQITQRTDEAWRQLENKSS